MSSPFPTPVYVTLEPEISTRWRRGFNGYGLVVTVVVHLILLAAVLAWRARAPAPPKPRKMDVSLILPKE